MTINNLTYGLLFLFGISFTCFGQNTRDDVEDNLAMKIDRMRIAFDFPAVAYGVIRNDSIITLNILGYRDIETKEEAQRNDYFNIGSNTKSFVAFLSGKLVDEGIIDWDTKFFDLFPELKKNSNSGYFDITLEQLLSHRARMIAFKEEPEVSTLISEYENSLSSKSKISEKKYHFVKHALQREPRPMYEECEDNCYSNAGFIAAGLMLEKASGVTLEELIMKLSDDTNLDLYIGWPVDYNQEQPKGHINPQEWVLDIEEDLVPISDQLRMHHYYNQFLLLCNPLSIKTEKFLTYLSLHLNGLKGNDNYLKSETYQHILTTYPKYSNGWWVDTIDGNIEYAHRGSNGTFYSFAGIFPDRNMGVVVMINTYSEDGLTEIIQEIIKTYR